jgi:sporulation protein YlmC with PRC-barrel domain
MKRFLMTTALVAFTTSPLMAQTATVLVIDSQYQTTEGMKINASNLIGKTVYIARENTDMDMDMSAITDVPDTWDDVADVSDIMIDADGKLGSIILDVGGFLGLGETEKTVRIENLKFVADTDDADEYFVVYTGSKQLLEDEDDYDTTALDTEGYRSAMPADTISNTNLTNDVNSAAAVTGVPMDRSTLTEASLDNLTADDLDGTPIYGVNDERIGEIGEVVLSAEGKISDVIVDVGGFLGIGERHVAMKLGQIALMEDAGGSMSGYVTMTKDQVEALDEWKKDS